MNIGILVFLYASLVSTSILSEYFSAALLDCFEERGPNGWEQILLKYFSSLDDFVPEKGNHPWPSSWDPHAKEIFTRGFVVGIPFFDAPPSLWFNVEEMIYEGYEYDLLEKCVFPRIQQKYSVPPSEFKYEYKHFPQNDEDFFTHVKENLMNGEADLMLWITYFDWRAEFIDYSQPFLAAYAMCIRSNYEPDRIFSSYEVINSNKTKIVAITGATYYFTRDNFPVTYASGGIRMLTEVEVIFAELKDSPEAHLYCVDASGGMFWLQSNNLVNNFSTIPTNITGYQADILGWAFKKDLIEEDVAWYIWVIIGVSSFLCGCCIIVFLLLTICCVLGVILFVAITCFSVVGCTSIGSVIVTRKVGGGGRNESQGIEDSITKLERSNSARIQINKDLFEIKFEQITMIKSIGQGGSSASIFLAKWRGMEVAFKCYRRVFSSNTEYKEFEKEAEIMMSVSHPYILKCYGATIQVPRVGIVVEYCPNGDLHDYFASRSGKKESFKVRLRLIKETLAALDYLHERRILHRDVKCENVLLSKALEARVMDFGLSKIYSENSMQGHRTKTSRIGTNIYMAPEVTKGGHYDYFADVFSLGIMMYILTTGNFRPYGKRSLNVELQVANDPLYRPDFSVSKRTDVPNYIKEITRCLWDHDPVNRMSMSQLNKLLEEDPTEFSYEEHVRRKGELNDEDYGAYVFGEKEKGSSSTSTTSTSSDDDIEGSFSSSSDEDDDEKKKKKTKKDEKEKKSSSRYFEDTTSEDEDVEEKEREKEENPPSSSSSSSDDVFDHTSSEESD